jgi:heavy metal translocating P-type ATPase
MFNRDDLERNLITVIVLIVLLIVRLFIRDEEILTVWKSILVTAILLLTLPFIFEMGMSLTKSVHGVDIIALAAIFSALVTNEVYAAAIVLFMLSGGEFLEHFAERKARNSLEKLLRQAPQKAYVYKDNELVEVPVQDVHIGDIVGIKKGDSIPVDGIVYEGTSVVDESMITGESFPRTVTVGDVVMSGSVHRGEFFTIQATATSEKSIFAGIISLISQAEKQKPQIVTKASIYSLYFTVVTFLFAFCAYIRDPHLAVAVLVVATPCPLLLAAPIAFIAGMSRSAKRGIVVKYGSVFEKMVSVEAFFFDKTGTLTLGTPSVKEVEVMSGDFSTNDVIRIAATLESYSEHVFAQGIVEYAKQKSIAPMTGTNIEETTGAGVIGTIKGQTYYVGSISFLKNRGIIFPKGIINTSVVYVAKHDIVVGAITFSDTIRSNAKQVIQQLHGLVRRPTFTLLTGDEKDKAEIVGSSLGFTKVFASCLPEDKVKHISEYEKGGMHVAMIGDGINDSPALASATVGIALGIHGATEATDVADAVITIDDLGRVSELVSISKDTVRIAEQSMVFGMGLSVIAMLFAYYGYLPPVEGALLQEGIDVLMIANALRAL